MRELILKSSRGKVRAHALLNMHQQIHRRLSPDVFRLFPNRMRNEEVDNEVLRGAGVCLVRGVFKEIHNDMDK